MPAKVGFLLSALLHGTALVLLAGMDYSSPSAPALAGGGGSGTFEIRVGSRLTEEAGQEAGQKADPQMAATAPPAASTAPQEPASAREPAENVAEHALEKPEEIATAESAVEQPVEKSEEVATAEKRPPAAVEPPPPEETRPAPEAPPARNAGDEPLAVSAVAALNDPAAAPTPAQGAGRPSEAGGGPGNDAPRVDDPGALRPVYPLQCRRLGHQGVVVLRVAIGADGMALEVEVLQSGGCPDLDRAAVEAVRRARFHPARQWGRAVACTIEQTFRFELRR